ncbi:hypothetical protein [Thalassotalea sp. PLHSN55]|uniref:hypothetical protein n=1 Tax=Thalassotalea sp. PLHSN55 TaxID=3435888 RepID=UPI003F836310
MNNAESWVYQVETFEEYNELMNAQKTKTQANAKAQSALKNQKITNNLYCFYNQKKHTKSSQSSFSHAHINDHKLNDKKDKPAATQNDKNKQQHSSNNLKKQLLPMYTDVTTINIFSEDTGLTKRHKSSSKMSRLLAKWLTLLKGKK